MRSTTILPAVVCLCLLLTAPWSAADAPVTGQANDLHLTVRYTELPEAGPSQATGRLLPRTRAVGIDIDSTVVVEIDEEALELALARHLAPTQLASPELQLLLQQITALEQAAARIAEYPAFSDAEVTAYTAYLAAADSARDEKLKTYRAASKARAEHAGKIIDPLWEVMQRRLLRYTPGLSEREASRAAAHELQEIIPGGEQLGYDLDALGRRYQNEIRALEQEVESALRVLASDSGLAIEIRATYVRRDGSAQGIALPGHNSADIGAPTRFKRVDLTPPEAESQLRQRYDELAQQIRTTRSSGDRLRLTLEAAFDDDLEELETAADAFRMDLDRYPAAVDGLRQWGSRDRLAQWFRDVVAPAVQSDPQVKEAYTSFQQSLSDAVTDLDAIRTLVEALDRARHLPRHLLFEELLTAVIRVQTRLGELDRPFRPATWEARIMSADRLMAALAGANLSQLAAADGPIKVWRQAHDLLITLVADAQAVTGTAHRLLARLGAGSGAVLMSGLPIPKDQQRRSIADNLDTRFDLLTVPGTRAARDRVALEYHLYYHDEELDLGWTDAFELQVYGWRGRALAGLLLVRQEKSASDKPTGGAWEPTATTHFLFRHRSWPKTAGETGLDGSWLQTIGLGVSTMPLHFDDEQDVEVGIGLTLSLLNDLVQIGYGTNLQAREHAGFFYFGLRVLSIKDGLQLR